MAPLLADTGALAFDHGQILRDVVERARNALQFTTLTSSFCDPAFTISELRGTKITWGGPPVAPKTGANRLSFELALPSGADWQAEVGRLVSLGATRSGTGEGDGEGGRVLMFDPDGNEFFVQRPR
ncbi:hypothetical protein AMK21_30005 [Streptomyces sp. CB00316]|nr:hypothetical protein AMK21_30005 [Streptomyces sp. CB00316]